MTGIAEDDGGVTAGRVFFNDPLDFENVGATGVADPGAGPDQAFALGRGNSMGADENGFARPQFVDLPAAADPVDCSRETTCGL